MKKFRIVSIAAVICFVSLLTGCAPNGGKVINYLKGESFVGSSDKYIVYEASLSVADDLSFALDINYAAGNMPDFKTEGTGLEYMGCVEHDFTSEWLGIEQNNTSYSHVVKLTGATFEDGDKVYSFFVVAITLSKNSDSFSLSIVRYKERDDGSVDIDAIANAYEKFDIRKNKR